ncbi:MAG: Panacea domain-containing protein [Gemmataceae bacterium]
MSIHFNFEKTLQATGVLLEGDGGSMEYIRLLKLLYIADRTLLGEVGRTLTGDRAVAMDHGPVLCRVYDTIKGQTADAGRWAEFVHKDGYKVVLKKTPGRGKLSKREVALLNKLTEQYRNATDWELVEETHEFGEWKANHRPGTSTPIPWPAALEAQGKSDRIAVADQEARIVEAIDQLFGG